MSAISQAQYSTRFKSFEAHPKEDILPYGQTSSWFVTSNIEIPVNFRDSNLLHLYMNCASPHTCNEECLWILCDLNCDIYHLTNYKYIYRMSSRRQQRVSKVEN